MAGFQRPGPLGTRNNEDPLEKIERETYQPTTPLQKEIFIGVKSLPPTDQMKVLDFIHSVRNREATSEVETLQTETILNILLNQLGLSRRQFIEAMTDAKRLPKNVNPDKYFSKETYETDWHMGMGGFGFNGVPGEPVIYIDAHKQDKNDPKPNYKLRVKTQGFVHPEDTREYSSYEIVIIPTPNSKTASIEPSTITLPDSLFNRNSRNHKYSELGIMDVPFNPLTTPFTIQAFPIKSSE